MKQIFLDHWKAFCGLIPATFVLTYLLTLGLPNIYRAEAKFVQEEQSVQVYGGLGAQQAIGLPTGVMEQSDAVKYLVVPDIVKSKDFYIGLMDQVVRTQDGLFEGSLYAYLTAYQKKYIFSPKPLAADELARLNEEAAHFDPNGLSKAQEDALKLLVKNLSCTVNMHTQLITITSNMQDPAVAAQVANLSMTHLQDYMHRYHKQKAEAGLRFYDEVIRNASEEYAAAVEAEAAYTGKDQLQARLLRDDVAQKYDACSALQAQRSTVRSRLMEDPVAFAVFQTGYASNIKSQPHRGVVAILVTMLAAMLALAWWARKLIMKLF